MNATTTTLMLAALAALLMAPASAASADTAEAGKNEGPCDTFVYSVDPPGYHLDPSCMPMQADPVFDNSP